jgi:hypothetical protein
MASARPEQIESIARDRAEQAHREARPRERLAPHELVVQPHRRADGPDFVLEQHAERFDQLEAHPIGQAADVVVALDRRRRPDDRNAFDDVGIQGALREKVEVAQLLGALLEDVDERGADEPCASARGR